MSSWTFDPGVTGQLIRRYTMGNCMLLSWTDYARSKNETKQKLINNKGKQSKPTQIKCENESHHQSNCSVIFVCLFCLLFLPDFCWRKRFCGRVKALGHSILVTKAKGTFVQVWARNVLQPSKLKFLLGRHLVTNSFGLGRLFYKSSRQLQNFSRDGKLGRLSYVTSKGDAVVRALASHQCGPGSNPGVDAICGLSLLLVLSLAPRGFSPGTPVFPSP